MIRGTLATLLVATGMGLCLQGPAVAATSKCRTVHAEGTDTSNPPTAVVAHVCDRIEIDFVIGTQGQIVPDWNLSRQPAKKIAKFVSKKYGSSASSGDTATQEFLFRTVSKGKTSAKFRETTSSPGYGTLDSFTLKITVLPRRTGR